MDIYIAVEDVGTKPGGFHDCALDSKMQLQQQRGHQQVHKALSFNEATMTNAEAATTTTTTTSRQGKHVPALCRSVQYSRGNTFGIEPPDTATVNTPRASTESVAIVPIRRTSSVARASESDPMSKVVVI